MNSWMNLNETRLFLPCYWNKVTDRKKRETTQSRVSQVVNILFAFRLFWKIFVYVVWRWCLRFSGISIEWSRLIPWLQKLESPSRPRMHVLDGAIWSLYWWSQDPLLVWIRIISCCPLWFSNMKVHPMIILRTTYWIFVYPLSFFFRSIFVS